MFFRTTIIKGTPLVQLVQSYRNAEGLPRQRVIASLGDARLPKGEERQKDLFSLSRSVILYDVTNTHFEGLCRKNPKARHGRNKQKRNDCRQVAVGMAFSGRCRLRSEAP